MADRVNSGKKIDYAKNVGEALATSKRDIQKSVETIKAMCDNAKFATADRCYNQIAEIATILKTAINQYALSVADQVLEPLVTGEGAMMSGQALKLKVNEVKPELEAIAAGSPEVEKIPSSVIDSRGLDENWTDSIAKTFGEECASFINIRAVLMANIADITHKCVETDTKTVYQNLGKVFEEKCNESATTYSGLKEQLVKAGMLVQATIDTMENAYSNINVESVGAAKDILGADDDI